MICDACHKKFMAKSEQGIYSRYKDGEGGLCIKHNHLCKACCKVVEHALKTVVIKDNAKHLPDAREFL